MDDLMSRSKQIVRKTKNTVLRDFLVPSNLTGLHANFLPRRVQNVRTVHSFGSEVRAISSVRNVPVQRLNKNAGLISRHVDAVVATVLNETCPMRWEMDVRGEFIACSAFRAGEGTCLYICILRQTNKRGDLAAAFPQKVSKGDVGVRACIRSMDPPRGNYGSGTRLMGVQSRRYDQTDGGREAARTFRARP